VSDLEFIRIDAEALYRFNETGRIVGINEPDGDRGPRVFLGRTREGNIWRFRDDLSDELVAELEAILEKEPVVDDLEPPPLCQEALIGVLNRHEPVSHVWNGPAWYFPEDLPPPPPTPEIVLVTAANRELVETPYPDLGQDIEFRSPCMVILDDARRPISMCFNARLTDRAAEAGVDTDEAYRGRGYAVAVTIAWAKAIRASGRIPLYSTSWDNAASRRVAAKLGLILYGTDCSIG
jgi:hypothetical protein